MDYPATLTFPVLLENSFSKFGHLNAMAYAGEKPMTYNELENQVSALIAFLEKLSIKQGDKVAILSLNMPNWGIAYFALTSMGVVVVPLLPDFSPSEIENVLVHSGVEAIFVSGGLFPKFFDLNIETIKVTISLDDFSLIGDPGIEAVFDPSAKPVNKYAVEEDDLAAIIYTSGTAGKSKGVMLSQKNICFTAIQAQTVQDFGTEDRFLSILPLSHTYENTLGLVLPVFCGSCIYYLRKPPTPAVLLPALAEIRPTAVLSVPLIIEKIYRNKILPSFTENRLLNQLYKSAFIRKQLNKVAGKKLMKTFGGELKFFGIGGAKLDRTVEQFLLEAEFPYAIGYGLTESAPLLAGFNPKSPRLQSTGPKMEGVELKINSPDKETGEGEIWAKGPNVMIGYYKEAGLTEEVKTEDGWLKTGDLGVFDEDGYLFIKGRLKNMILGSNGENIYPEEIESVINNFNFVMESLVVEQKGKLVALVHFNSEEIETRFNHLKDEFSNYTERKTGELQKELQEYVNARVNKFSRLQLVVAQAAPFQKTATHKIKRYLYKE
jgi:long-chain acyl-CoA synthetase